MSEQIRSEFEAWYETTYGISLEREFRSNHFIGYVNDKANHRWAAWQASRAALCVELPWSNDSDLMDQIEECRSAIHAAGVKTK